MEARRILQTEWLEDERSGRIRQLYRVAARGTILADGYRTSSAARSGTPQRAAAGDAGAAGATEAGAATGLPATIDAYVERVGQLNLSGDRRNDVSHEIRDHLEDSAAEYVRQGHSEAEAVRLAIAGLGAPDVLANRIAHEELTRARLAGGIRRAAVSALFGAAIGLAFATLFVLLLPIVARLLVNAIGSTGVRLYLPDTPEWRAQQTGLILAAAAFFGARRSTLLASQWTRRSLRDTKPIWGLGGGAVALAVAFLAPSNFDALAAVAFLAIPAGWLLGTWRNQRPGDDLISRWGALQAGLLALVFLFVPAVRVFTFNPATPVSDPAPRAQSSVHISVNITTDSLQVGGDTGGWSDFRIEAYPALRHGVDIVPDQTRQAAFGITPGSAFAASSLPRTQNDWWLVLTAMGSDGQRHTLDVAVLPGTDTSPPRGLAAWLLLGR
jgi:hypothetical protein